VKEVPVRLPLAGAVILKGSGNEQRTSRLHMCRHGVMPSHRWLPYRGLKVKRNDALDETIAAFRAAGLEPDVERTRHHIKVRCAGLCIVVSNSLSDHRAALQAKTLARRLIKNRRNGRCLNRPQRNRVVRSFLAGKRDKAGAFHTAGGVLYSYNLALAKMENGRAVALPGLDERHSMTTSGHQSVARLAVNSPGSF
jgi:hypothetical protein